MEEYESKKKTLEILKISHMTLFYLAKNNQIEYIKTKGGHRRYNVKKYINNNNNKSVDNLKLNICYVRVSSIGQKDDLERQKEYMIKKYPKHNIIEDIGSGINFNRKGLRKIIKYGIEGKINEIVVAYKDRLTRFGYELIEDLIKTYSNGKIIIENEKESKEPEIELAEDVLQIMNVFVAKRNGLRKYK